MAKDTATRGQKVEERLNEGESENKYYKSKDHMGNDHVMVVNPNGKIKKVIARGSGGSNHRLDSYHHKTLRVGAKKAEQEIEGAALKGVDHLNKISHQKWAEASKEEGEKFFQNHQKKK